MMLRISMPVEKSNAAVADGSLPKQIEALMARIRPECAYFFPDSGRRSMLMVFNIDDSSQIPPTVEPLFAGLNAEVTLTPVMNAEELQKGLAAAAGRR
jgi:hypothetical protein